MEFDTIWAEYERELSAFVLSRVQDVEVQKEVMQEVGLKIFTSLHSQKEHLRGWLYMLTKHAISDYYRKVNKPLPELEDDIVTDEHILFDCLHPMLDTLKTEEKEILQLTQLQQYSLSEVASKKNIPLNTAKSQLFRAKKALAGKFFSCCAYERNKRGDVVNVSVESCTGKFKC